MFNVVIAHLAHAIRQFQVVQHKDRSVTLRVAPTPTYDAEHRGGRCAQTWERYLPGVPGAAWSWSTRSRFGATGKRQVVVVER